MKDDLTPEELDDLRRICGRITDKATERAIPMKNLYIQKHSSEEIAEKMGIPEEYVRDELAVMGYIPFD